MAGSIFRFYSTSPRAVHRAMLREVEEPVVRFHGWKCGRSRLYKMTVVVQDEVDAVRFGNWLSANARTVDLGVFGLRTGGLLHQPSLCQRLMSWALGGRK